MSAPRVVEALDEVEDLEPCLVAALEGPAIDQLALEGGEERLGDSVVEGVAAATDRMQDEPSDSVLPKARLVYCEPRSE